MASGRRPAAWSADRLFFPAAALYGAVAVPLSVHGLLGGRPTVPGFAMVAGHAHELLFGFALAVVTGFLVTRASTIQLSSLFGLWLVARAAFLLFPGSTAALAVNLAYGALLASLVVPKLMKRAKKLRNQAFGPVVLAICLALGGFHVAQAVSRAGLQYLALRESVLMFALLMAFMGGRIIAPAAAGAIHRAGGHLKARVQPRIEGALILLLSAAAGLLVVPGGKAAAGGVLLIAGGLVSVRLIRWRLWRCAAHADLLCLGLGYAWLAAGLCLLGGSWCFGVLPSAAATHAITVGALGTLTTTVMARMRLLRAKLDPSAMRTLPLIALSISLAATIRIGWGGSPAGLWLAAGCWSLGLILLLATLWRIPAR